MTDDNDLPTNHEHDYFTGEPIGFETMKLYDGRIILDNEFGNWRLDIDWVTSKGSIQSADAREFASQIMMAADLVDQMNAVGR